MRVLEMMVAAVIIAVVVQNRMQTTTGILVYFATRTLGGRVRFYRILVMMQLQSTWTLLMMPVRTHKAEGHWKNVEADNRAES